MQTTKIKILLSNNNIKSVDDGIDAIIGIYNDEISKNIRPYDNEVEILTYKYTKGSISNNKSIWIVVYDNNENVYDASSFVDSIYGIADSFDNAYAILKKLIYKNAIYDNEKISI